MATPRKDDAYDFRITLNASDSNRKFKGPATITAGDFQISVDDAAFVPLINVPTIDPPNSVQVKISLTDEEMSGAKVTVWGSDPDGEWDDVFVYIDVPEINEDDMNKVIKSLNPFLHKYQTRTQFERTTLISGEDEADADFFAIQDVQDQGGVDFVEVLQCVFFRETGEFDEYLCTVRVRRNIIINAEDELDALRFAFADIVNFGGVDEATVQPQQTILLQIRTGTVQ